jgi:hypothetical protein
MNENEIGKIIVDTADIKSIFVPLCLCVRKRSLNNVDSKTY